MTTITQDTGSLYSYAFYLQRFYTYMSHRHSSQQWTHLPRCEFVNLAMITNQALRRGGPEEEMVRLAQQGKIETVISHKELITLSNIFTPLEPLVVLPSPPPGLILIEGAPGGGKSTLALHICQQWAQGISFLAKFDTIVLAYLRDRTIQHASTLADILPANTIGMPQTAATQIQACNGSNTLFIFDGWDEFPSNLQKQSVVSTIIQEPHTLSLCESTVLITSRPVSSGNLLHIVNKRVEILGFTQCQIRKYIEKALKGNSTQIQTLFQHLEDHPVIEGYCYVPLHAAILVHIFLTLKGTLPTTIHELFCNLVLCSIVRELKTHQSTIDLTEIATLDELPSEIKAQLSDLSALAYEGVMQDKVVFYQNDLKNSCLPSNFSPLGLLQAVEGLTLVSKSVTYNFLHLSVQELLAAYHISRMDPPSKQVEVLEHMIKSSRFLPVLCYYSGFTKLADPAVRKLIHTYSHQKSNLSTSLSLLHCLFEAQQPSLCQLVESHFDYINLNHLFTPVDHLVVGYIIASILSTSSFCQKTIYLNLKDSNDHKVKLLLVGLSYYPVGGQTTASALARRIVFEIDVNENITCKTISLIADHLKSSSPVISELSVRLNVNDVNNDNSLLHLVEALQTNNSLAKLKLFSTKLFVEQSTLSKMLQVNKTLTHLKLLSYNPVFTSSVAGSIFLSLQHNTTLVDLNLSYTGITATEDTTRALGEMLRVNKTLTHLNLSNNKKLADLGACCIFHKLQLNTTLVYLNLSRTGITYQGAEYIAQANAKCSHCLEILDISHNKFGVDVCHIIVKSLESNTSLRKISMYSTMDRYHDINSVGQLH